MVFVTLTVIALMLLPLQAFATQSNQNWDALVFDGESRAWDASRMKLVLENDGSSMTAYILVRDVYVDFNGQAEKVSWKGHPQEETSFNGLIQTRGLSTSEFINAIREYDGISGQLAGIFYTSDATGWELTNLRDHDAFYYQEIYSRVADTGTSFQREQVLFVLRGIPLNSDLVHGQFLLLYPGNPDGTTDHVWFNPGWMDERDHVQYWVGDCQDKDAEGEIINGCFGPTGLFRAENVPCAW